jgi:hypothetical protein
VRTDLDSFSDVEAYTLMTSAYRMTARALATGGCVEGYATPEREEKWDFLAVKDDMTPAGRRFDSFMRLLAVSGSLAFRIWKLNPVLKVLSWVLAASFVVTSAWLIWRYREKTIVEAVTYGAVGLFLATTALTALATMVVGKTFMRVLRLRETLIRAALGLFVGLLGWLAAWLHLSIFDRMFLRRGHVEVERREGGAARGGGGGRTRAVPPEAGPAATLARDASPQEVEVAGLGPGAAGPK